MTILQFKRLEQYTLKRPQEVLLVTVEMMDEPDIILIFKGFSSSLMHSTNFDPEVPVVSDQATITSIDRLASPYNPNHPQYLQQGLSWQQMQAILEEIDL